MALDWGSVCWIETSEFALTSFKGASLGFLIWVSFLIVQRT